MRGQLSPGEKSNSLIESFSNLMNGFCVGCGRITVSQPDITER